MSDDLADEVEAINSIYGPDTLIPDPDDASTAGGGGDAPTGVSSGEQEAAAGAGCAGAVYILRLPEGGSWLRIRFPPEYPSAPPVVVGTQRSSGGVRDGLGAAHVALFRDALGKVWEVGAVCVYDAVEEFVTSWEAARLAAGSHHHHPDDDDDEHHRDGNGSGAGADSDEHRGGGHRDAGAGAADEKDEGQVFPTPDWIASQPVTDSKSTFVAHVARVQSPAQARAYVEQLLDSDRRFRSATHNMTAWRIRGGSGSDRGGDSGTGSGSGVAYQDCDDDGETAAGSRLLRLMQALDLWDAMVVVSRWFGGVKLGPRRFALINGVARDAFVRAGMVVDKDKDSKKKAK